MFAPVFSCTIILMHNVAHTLLADSDLTWAGRFASNVIRVLAVGGEPLAREGIAALINKQSGLSVVAEAESGAQAIEYYRMHRPDVVTLGSKLPDMTCESLASRLVTSFSGARIVVITAARGDIQLQRILETGVRGMVSRGAPYSELIETIRQVHAGRRVIPGDVASTLAEHLGEESLTPREVQVLRLVAQGNRNKQVAGLLSIADETVRMHMKNILGKLRANDRTHAVTIALARGMFEL